VATSGNLEHWESLAQFHGTGRDTYYDLPALIRGDATLGGLERAAVDVATSGAGAGGLDIAHVQSHIGIDTILLAREGARLTAFDFSPTALQRLEELAADCGVSVATVVADSQQIASQEFAAWHGHFDLVYATVGVVAWIADLDAWMSGAAALLRPGGSLVLLDLHPLLCMIDSPDPLILDFPYSNDGARHFEGSGSYANREADLTWAIDQYAWSLGEIVTAAVGAGLPVTRLTEHLETSFDSGGGRLTRESDGMFRLRVGMGTSGGPAEPLPILFTLVARKPLP